MLSSGGILGKALRVHPRIKSFVLQARYYLNIGWVVFYREQDDQRHLLYSPAFGPGHLLFLVECLLAVFGGNCQSVVFDHLRIQGFQNEAEALFLPRLIYWVSPCYDILVF